MADRDGPGAPGSAEKSLGDIVSEASAKASLLVREGIELAKAEVREKVRKLSRGILFFAIAGIAALLGVIYLLHALAYLLQDLLDTTEAWPGYAIVTGVLFLVAAIGVGLGVLFMKRAKPPTPDMAIEEAKRTRAMLEEAREEITSGPRREPAR